MSCMSSVWCTTLPGVVATLRPSWNALSSVIEMRSLPPPFSRSLSRLFRPRTRFCPPLATVSRRTCGLVMRKLDGASASTYWRVKKATFFSDSSERPSTLATASRMWRELMRYDCLMRSNRKFFDQSSSLKRESLFSGSATGPEATPMSFIQLDCHRRVWSSHRFIDRLASFTGSAAMRAYRSMNALAMPISSRTAEDMSSACRLANSPRILEHRSATCWLTFASSALSVVLAGCITHDAIFAPGTRCASCVVEVVQVGYRLAHREESLVRVQRAAKQHAQELGCALGFFQGVEQFPQAVLVMLLQLLHPVVGAAERLAVRRQHQHVLWQVAIARDRVEEQAQRVAFGVDRPDADVGRDGGKQHVSRDERIQVPGVERKVLGRMAVAYDGAPAVLADLDLVALDDAPVRQRKFRHQRGVAVAASAHARRTLIVEPVLAEHRQHGIGGVAGGRRAHCVRRQVFALRHPELDTVALA